LENVSNNDLLHDMRDALSLSTRREVKDGNYHERKRGAMRYQKYLKKGVKIFFRVLFLLIFTPMCIHAGYLFVQSFMRTCSIYIAADFIQDTANYFMGEIGNRYFALDIIYYLSREREPFYHEDTNHNDTFMDLFTKYPEMKEVYLGALVEAILDKKTSNYNRINLIKLLQRAARVDFDGDSEKAEDYEDLKPYTQKAIRNIADWWSKHLEDNATASIAATEKDYKFSPLPKKAP